MRQLYWYRCVLVLITLFITACSAHAVQVQPQEPIARIVPVYEPVLGKSLTDKEVADFLAKSNCSRIEQFQLCKEIGIVLGVNSNQVVETVFIYLENTGEFTAYEGELPFRLKSDDRRETVEHKFKQQRVGTGVPNEGITPDHVHYWATYYSAGMTIIYNSPAADDQGATMHAILVRH